MARIPESELARLKAEVSLERLAIARGFKLTKKGRDLYGKCPFHRGDNEASFVISPAKNLWHCLGCGVGGSVVDFIMKIQGVSFAHAIQLLKADLPPSVAGPGPGSSSPPIRSDIRKLPAVLPVDAEDQVLLLQVVDFYHQTLRSTSEGLDYLRHRGLVHPEIIDRFKLGYSNRTLGYRLPAKSRVEGSKIRGRLEALGIYRSSGHEHLAGSLVVPIFDAAGRVVQLYGRKVGEKLRPGTAKHLYLPAPQRGVWNLEALKASREVILCEALLDALTFWCAGFRNVTTAYGVGGVTPDHWEAFKAHGTKRVLIAFDRDEAGEKAAAELAPRLQAAGIEAWRIQFPKGMDANEYAQKLLPAEKSLGLVIRNAVWMGAGKAPARAGAVAQMETPAAPPASILEGKTAAEGKSGVSPTAARIPPPVPPPLPSSAAGTPPPPAGPEPDPEPIQIRSVIPPGGIQALASRLHLEPDGDALVTCLGDRTYRIRGLEKNTSGTLKVHLRVSRDTGEGPGSGGVHLDTVDMVMDRQRQAFIKRAAEELSLTEEVIKRDLGQLLLAFELERDQAAERRLAPAQKAESMSEAERTEALGLLKDPRLLDRILEDFHRCGVVGEVTNKLIAYLATVSRKLERPLAVVIQSSSAAGKSSLMDAVLRFMPPEERVSYSAMTGQALFYMGGVSLAHKILAIAEEEGAQRASYALKLLQSEGELTIASTGKDPTTGKLVTHEYKVEGPVMIFMTTTAIEMDEELLNRCLVLSVDESREQTRAIHRMQRFEETLEGLLARAERPGIVKLHQNAQRLLRPLLVANPFAEELTFLDHQTRSRRDHPKYMALIRTLALLHQHQREVRTTIRDGKPVEFIEVTKADIAVANRLAREALGRSSDELPPQTRRLLAGILELVVERAKEQGIERSEVRFTRREVRERTGVGPSQAQVHMQRLEDMEYLLAHGGGPGHPRVYELIYQEKPENEGGLLRGLMDLRELPGGGIEGGNLPGPAGGVPGGCRPDTGGVPAAWRVGPVKAESPSQPDFGEDPPRQEAGNRPETRVTRGQDEGVVLPGGATRRAKGEGP